MKKIILIVPVLFTVFAAVAQFNAKMPVVVAPKFKKDTTNIKKFGAVPDGNTLNTKAINKAIDALSKAMDLDSKNPDVYYWLGLCLEEKKEKPVFLFISTTFKSSKKASVFFESIVLLYLFS